MKYSIQNSNVGFSFTTDLKFSASSYYLTYDGIPKGKAQFNFLDTGDGCEIQTDYFPFPYYGTFKIEVTNDEVWIYIDNESDFRLIKEAIEKNGIEVSPMRREVSEREL